MPARPEVAATARGDEVVVTLEGPPEVLEREYRGYAYVAEDLFNDDAAVLDEEGWDVHSAQLEEETGNGLARTIEAFSILTGTAANTPRQRSEYLLTVTYYRQPGWDG